MNLKKYILTYFLILLSIVVLGQRTETAINFSSEKNRLVFEVENDALFRSDNYYTAGLALSYTHQKIRNTPAQLLTNTKNPKNFTYSGFGFQQRLFTPYVIEDPGSIPDDRPYAAFLLLSNYSVLINSTKHFKLSNEIGVGIMGEAAKGEEVQTFVHELIGSTLPIGWNNQLENTFLIDYQLRIEKGLFSDWTANHFVPFSAIRAGTLTNRIQFGLMTKWGNKNNYLQDATAPLELNNKLIWEWVFEANLQGVFYDATLHGSMFKDDPNALSTDETTNRQYQFRTGLNLYYKKFSFRYMVKFNSTDFKSAVIHRYASLNVGVAF